MTSFVAALQRTINAEVILGHPLQNGCQAAKRLGTDEATTTLTNTDFAKIDRALTGGAAITLLRLDGTSRH
jgi:hypothetical protein